MAVPRFRVGRNSQRLFKRSDGVLKTFQPREDHAAIVPSLEITGIPGGDFRNARQRGFKLTASHQQNAVKQQRFTASRIELQCRVDRREGFRPLLLIKEERELVLRRETPRIDPQNLLIEALGFGEVTGLMKRDRLV